MTANFKQHALIVIISGAATLGFSYQVLLPIFNQQQENIIASQRKRIDDFQNQTKNLGKEIAQQNKILEEKENYVSEIEATNQELSLKNDALERANIISSYDIYPNGLKNIKIGDDISQAKSIYENLYSEENGWIEVQLPNGKNSVFSEALYYYDKKDQIYQIFYKFSDSSNDYSPKHEMAYLSDLMVVQLKRLIPNERIIRYESESGTYLSYYILGPNKKLIGEIDSLYYNIKPASFYSFHKNEDKQED